jgi:hypothetical protein
MAAFHVSEVHKQTDKVATICKTDRCNLAKELDKKSHTIVLEIFTFGNLIYKKKSKMILGWFCNESAFLFLTFTVRSSCK